MESDVSAPDGGPRAAVRTLRLLAEVAAAPDGISLARVSEQVDAPKSSLLGVLRAMVAGGYLVHAGGQYLLGPEAYRLGLALVPAVSLSRLARPVMEELARAAGETVLIGVIDRETRRVVYVEKVESANSVRYTVPLGTSRPLYCSSAGRVLLAGLPDAEIEAYLRETDLAPLTSRTLTHAATLRALLHQIREEGVAVTHGEVSADVAGFAAPLHDEAGRVVAALAMAAPINRSEAATSRCRMLIREAARTISRGLGKPDETPLVGRRTRIDDGRRERLE